MFINGIIEKYIYQYILFTIRQNMKGIILFYKPKTYKSLTRFNQKLFGRLSKKRYGTKVYVYYVKGLLHSTKFIRIIDGKYFIETNNVFTDEIIKDLSEFCDISITNEERDIDELMMKTGEEYWTTMAKEKGVLLNGRK